MAAGISVFGGYGLGAAVSAALAVVAILLGLIVLFFASQLKSHPQSAKTSGIVILILALLSFIGGGGFFIGAILAFVGGILAIVWSPPAPAPTPGYGQPMQAPPAAGTPGQKFCGSCGAPNAAGVRFCSQCGAPLPP